MIRAIAMFVLICSGLSVRAEIVPLTAATSGCTRESLRGTVDKYLDALKKGTPSLMPLTPQAKYMENRNEVPIGQGIWQAPLAVDFNRSVLDVETCQTFNDPNASCTVGMPKHSSVKIINRHFVVDVDMGTVVGMVDFREEKRNPDSHMFRLENGKLRYVHAIQVCTVQPNCGLPLSKAKPQ